MIVGIAGSREYSDPPAVAHFVMSLAQQMPDTVVVSGGRGIVDTQAEATARYMGLDVISYRPVEVKHPDRPSTFEIVTYAYGEEAETLVQRKQRRTSSPDYDSFGKCAFGRNIWVVDDSDRLVAFWDGQSAGTAHALDIAESKGIPRSVKPVGRPMQALTSSSSRAPS